MAMVKTQEEITLMREAGHRLARVLDAVEAAVAPGVTTKELDELAEHLIREGGDTPSFLKYQPQGASYPFPASACISVNEEVVHGIPGEKVLKEGDIVGIDLGVCHKGYHADSARTIAVGPIDETAQRLIDTTKHALFAGIAAARAGNTVGDIGAAIQVAVADSGFSIVRELGGHGIGDTVHEEPFIQNFGVAGEGVQLKEGMVVALEPIINEGTPGIALAKDGYTFRAKDGTRSAHFEHTILITEDEPEIFTRV